MGRKTSLTSDTDRHEPAADQAGVGRQRLDFLKTGLDQTFLKTHNIHMIVLLEWLSITKLLRNRMITNYILKNY